MVIIGSREGPAHFHGLRRATDQRHVVHRHKPCKQAAGHQREQEAPPTAWARV